MAEPQREKVVIIGSGPGGLSAAIYAARANLHPLVLEGLVIPSQISVTTDVENYPGFPTPIAGPDLIDALHEQAEKSGARFESSDVASVDLSVRPFKIIHGWDQSSVVFADTIIIATGATARKLDVPGADKFWMKSISACAVCDSFMARDKEVAVIGGGDAAVEEAMYLTKHAKRVHLIHRRDQLRASVVMQKRILESDVNIIWNHTVSEFVGDDKLDHLVLTNTVTGERSELKMDTAFYGIGHDPAVGFLQGQLELRPSRHILLPHPHSQMTSVPGVFACGDVSDWVYRQAICAAGQGAAAALDAERWLTEQGL